ncbi:serine hydrolase [Kineosporia babensis]|uniref:Class A beta-lactamase-related serine hydrolase n=1 Tax=Kineosporia babensis TaxID=499548 RepID=A0A9X1NM50_9ACTN|nr:serine hydrolase [Kineosporia babensis]MCD5316319.1 class A beta-lactamase-related serine hydrolase [Kineosporia babensis]
MRLIEQLRQDLDDGGLRGSFLVRDLDSGAEIGIEPDLEYPAASLVKVPLALATLDRIRTGEINRAEPILVNSGDLDVPGLPGLTKFRHPATIALEDLLYLSVCLSDSTASDILLERTPPAAVTEFLRAHGHSEITVRHRLMDLSDTPAERFPSGEGYLAHSLAIGAGTAGRGHPVPQLDVSRANSGTARAYTDLLQAIWRPSSFDPAVAERTRELLGNNILRQRLAPDFASDASRWSSKTGTLLNLRHEIGVVEHADGQTFAVVVLTESRVAATVQPGAEALMAAVARRLRDHLRH